MGTATGISEQEPGWMAFRKRGTPAARRLLVRPKVTHQAKRQKPIGTESVAFPARVTRAVWPELALMVTGRWERLFLVACGLRESGKCRR